MAANQNVTQLTQQTVSANTTSLFYAVTGSTTDTGLPFSVLVNNLGLTGIPTAPTPGSVVSTTQIVTGAYVANFYAPLASPTFTGTPTLPTGTIAVTQSPGNSSTAPATTAFVATSFAPLASPALTGTPTVPTATTGTATTAAASTAFVANTFGAPPALGITTPNSVAATTITASSTITPSTTAGIVGTTTANNANAGSIGEVITNNAAGISMTTATSANITSVSLTAGDWDVYGNVAFQPAGSTVTQQTIAGLSTTTATLPGNPSQTINSAVQATGQISTAMAVPTRINVSSTTTVFLVANTSFTVSTMTAQGVIVARRRR